MLEIPAGFRIAPNASRCYAKRMKLQEIEREAIALPEGQRVDLVCKLLNTLPPPGTEVSDEEVAARERELESGTVEPLSHEEFVHRVRAERGR